MTDGKGDRSLRPSDQATQIYVHIKERRADGIVIRGAKAIITAVPYVHEYLVMPCRNMTEADAFRRLLCAPIDAEGMTIISCRPVGTTTKRQVMPNTDSQPGSQFLMMSSSHGIGFFWLVNGTFQLLTSTYATHHRHSCIGRGPVLAIC